MSDNNNASVTTIHELIRNQALPEINSYIESGGDLNLIDKLKRTPIHLAAWMGDYDILLLLIRNKAKLDVKAMDGFTPLHFAVQSKGPRAAECVRLLCKKGKALLHQRITKGNKTALHLAAPKGNVDIINVLLEFGLDPQAKTGTGQSAVDLAGDPKIIKLLLNYKKKDGKNEEENQEGNEESDNDNEIAEPPNADSEPKDNETVGNKRAGEEEKEDTEPARKKSRTDN
jgi:ankyrin repeat protein